MLHFTTLLLSQRWTLGSIARLMAMIDLHAKIAPALGRSLRAIDRDERKIQREAVAAKLAKAAVKRSANDGNYMYFQRSKSDSS